MQVPFSDTDKITVLTTANLGLGSIQHWLDNLEMLLRIAVSLGQFAVAVVTVIYIIKKIRQATKTVRRRRK